MVMGTGRECILRKTGAVSGPCQAFGRPTKDALASVASALLDGDRRSVIPVPTHPLGGGLRCPHRPEAPGPSGFLPNQGRALFEQGRPDARTELAELVIFFGDAGFMKYPALSVRPTHASVRIPPP